MVVVLFGVPEMSSKKLETMTSYPLYSGYIIIEGYQMVLMTSIFSPLINVQ